jgi:acetylornithine/succinyldiaminopimelate/putrescine aminotransferase
MVRLPARRRPPDVTIIGKALSGGFYPVSAVLSDKEVLGLFHPGDHGSTFGGNPLGSAIGRAALDVIVEENLVERSRELGAYFKGRLERIESEVIKEVRGKGLFIGVELHTAARPLPRRCVTGAFCARRRTRRCCASPRPWSSPARRLIGRWRRLRRFSWLSRWLPDRQIGRP